MKLSLSIVTCLVAAFLCAEEPKPTPPATSESWSQVSSRARIEAEKAALTEAKKNMITAINGLQFGPQRAGGPKLFVSDLSAEYETIKVGIEDYVKAIQPLEDAKYGPNLICEVTLALPTKEMIALVSKLRDAVVTELSIDAIKLPPAAVKLKSYNLNFISSYYKDENGKPNEWVTAVGTARPPEQFIRRSGTVPPTQPAVTLPTWATQTLTIKARGDASPAVLLAAQYDALRQIQVLKFDDKTTIGDLAAKHPKVFNTLCHFVATTAPQTSKTAESNEVTLSLSLETLYAALKNLLFEK